MISRYLFGTLVALGLLIGIISGAPAPAPAPAPGRSVRENSLLGRSGYQLDIKRDYKGTLWSFEVYSDGYDGTRGKEKPADGAQDESRDKTLDHFRINTATKTLIVESVWNKYDKTPNRLRLKDILHACWLKTGLKELQLKIVQGNMIRNPKMEDAVKFCRQNLGVGNTDDFKVKPDAKGTKCWERLEATEFSRVIKGAISKFGPSKKLVQVELEYHWTGDNVMYTFQ